MRLRQVTTSDHRRSIAVEHEGRWAPIIDIAGLPDSLDPTDLIALLGAPDEVWETIRGGLADASTQSVTMPAELPFLPLGLRDFPLWRSEIEAVAATAVKRFASPLQQRALKLVGRRGAEAMIRVVGSHWEAVPQGIRGNHIGIFDEGQPMPWPSFTQALDVEFGIGAIVARSAGPGRQVSAADVIGGYTIVATAVARDVEHDELHFGRFGPSVSRDIGTVMASDVVTPHVLASGHLAGLGTRLTVGEELWANGTTTGAQHELDDVLTRAAQAGGLNPGELVVVTGIPGGSGAGLDRWVSPGDLVTFDIEQVGSLSVRIGDPQPHLHHGPLRRPHWTVVERGGHGPFVAALDPGAWQPPPVPQLIGPLAGNTSLDGPEVWVTKGAEKPEDVVVSQDGFVYAGVEDGRIFRWPKTGGEGEVVADTHGRPLGLEVNGQGDLIVCDADRGLIRVPIEDGSVGDAEVLAGSHAGLALKFANNAGVADDGTVYFTDSSTRFGIHEWRQDILEHRPNGRLFALPPGRSGQLELLLDGLFFPNGVALSPDQDFLLFVETACYSVSRFWLSGPRAGEREVLTDALPGFPDNMCPVGDGTYWIALPTRRNPALDALLPRPKARKMVDRLPEAIQPSPDRYSLVVRIDGEGEVLESLHGPAGDYAMVTGMRQHDGWLYLSSLAESGIARIRLAGQR